MCRYAVESDVGEEGSLRQIAPSPEDQGGGGGGGGAGRHQEVEDVGESFGSEGFDRRHRGGWTGTRGRREEETAAELVLR